MNSICLLEAERNGIKQNNLIINMATENRLYISGMDTSMKIDSVDKDQLLPCCLYHAFGYICFAINK